MNILEKFKSDIKDYIDKHEISASEFGKLSINDACLVGDINNKGRSPSAKTMQRVYDFMEQST